MNLCFRLRFVPLVIALLLVATAADALAGWGLRCRTRRAWRCCQAQVQCGATTAAAAPKVAEKNWKPLFDGKTLDGWQVADKFEFDGSGPAKIDKGTIRLPIGGPQAGIRYEGAGLPRMNYEIELDARRTDGVDFFCGMTFPVKEDYCTLIVGGWGGTIVGLSNVDGLAAAGNETTLERSFEHGRWYRIRLRVSEHRVSVWFDDEQVIDLASADKDFDIWWEMEPMRPLGIASWFTASQLRDIKLRELSTAEIAADAAAVKEAAAKAAAEKAEN